MKTSLSRIGISALALAGIALGSLVLAAPASANGGAGVTPVGVVCGAPASTTITVSQTGARASTPVKYVDAISAAVTADKPALTAQRDRNVAAGLTTPAIKSGSTITWKARTDAQGCATIPATGAAASTVTVIAGNKTASVTFAPMPDASLRWTEATTASGATANARTLTQAHVQADRVGYSITLN